MRDRIAAIGIAAALCAVAVAKTAVAEDYSRGASLLKQCEAAVSILKNPSVTRRPEDHLLAGRCFGVVSGVVGFIETAETLDWVPSWSGICMASSITNEEQVQVVTKYMENHRETLDMSGADITYVALRKTFPCPGLSDRQIAGSKEFQKSGH